jgi:ABC-type branched-subunit amino acid transport system substrate-binding protein
MKRSFALLAVVITVLAGACAAKGTTEGSTSPATTTTKAPTSTSTKFGTMASPCGHDVDGKKITLKADEAGTSPDKLYIGVANDQTAEARPGLLKEVWDSTVAFANWCNEQGGIGGLQVVPVDLDGQLFKVESAMTTACSQTFALVGGGWAQDNLVFTGKDGSDFHKCKMIAFPGFAVSTDFSDANGVIQPSPSDAYRKPITPAEDLQKLYPEEVKKTTAVYGEGLDSVRINKDQFKAVMEKVPGYGFLDDISFKLLNQDFSVTAQKVMDLGATAEYFVGEPEDWSSLLAELKTKGYKGISFAETNEYDPKLFVKGPDVANGALIRLGIHPFEEADKWPATKQFLDIMKTNGPPGAKIASLGVSSFSAGLLFATAVNDCARSTGGQVDRACVINAAKKVTSWDAGGLQAPADPSGKSNEACIMYMVAENGKFERKFPALGSKDDTTDGFHCDPNGIVPIEGNFGHGNVDPSLPY